MNTRVSAMALLLTALTARAAGPPNGYELLPYRGILQQNGAPYTRPVVVRFSLLRGSTPVYNEDINVQPASDGSFSVLLGQNGMDPSNQSIAIGTVIEAAGPLPLLNLSISIGGTALAGKQQIGAAPLATSAESVVSVGLDRLEACVGNGVLQYQSGWNCTNDLPALSIENLTSNNVTAGSTVRTGGVVSTHVESLQTGGTHTGLGLEDASDAFYWTLAPSATARKLFFSVFNSANNAPFPILTSVDLFGTWRTLGSFASNSGPDLAETIPSAPNVEAADVVCADPEHAERAVRCQPGQRVLGVISDGSGGFLINAHARSLDAPLTGRPLVLAGRVPVKMSGPIQIGDLLAPASTPGVAMRATGPGPTVGIALEASDGNKKTVLCFVKAGEGNLVPALQRAQERNQELTRQIQTIESRLARLEATASR